ncbi:MAG: glycosyltransferase [Ignavibacteriae bacterium]|nr:glycosyltransferase [Ignavibacteriota bacterium]NOG98455.1 glycosyltransferase [Ignavibacteriota bacterium]
MEKKQSNGLIIFAKYPSKGRVKTRLANGIGDDNALLFYNKCAAYIFNEASKLSNIKTYLFYEQPVDEIKMKEWVGQDFEFRPQLYADLGNKMCDSFKFVFNCNADKAVIVGTDVPDLTAQIIEKSFKLLDKNDLVISPSPDGGYNLLGMNKLHKNLFENIIWSSSEVLNKTLEIARRNNLKINIMDELMDIDNVSELLDWLSKSDEGNIHLKNQLKDIVDLDED